MLEKSDKEGKYQSEKKSTSIQMLVYIAENTNYHLIALDVSVLFPLLSI